MHKLAIILLFSCSVIAQKNIRVEYTAKVNPLEKKFDFDRLQQMFDYAVENDDNFRFELLISKKQSRFTNISVMPASESPHLNNIALNFTGYVGEVYNFEEAIYSECFGCGTDVLLKRPKKENWVLTNETKEIDGYLCYKATNIYKVVGSEKTFNHPVVAWYCPKLPYGFGPNGYGNLPGLILELQVRNVVFGLKKIEFNSELTLDFSFLKTVKTTSEEELNTMLQKQNEAEFKNFR